MIAHGMYTMALAARAVPSWFPGAEVVSFGCKFTNPVVVPAEGGVDLEVAGEVKGADDGLTTVALERHLRGPEGARHAEGRPGRAACLSCSPTTPPCASAARPGGGSRATTEDELVAAVGAADAAGEPVLVLGGGSNLVVADAGFPGTVVEVATRGVVADVDDDDPTCGGVDGHASPRGSTGTTSSPSRSSAAGSASRRCRASPGSVGATPIQNVGAYGQEVAQTIASRPGLGPAAAAACAPSPTPTAASATAPAGSRPTPAATSSSTVTFQFRQGDLGAPVRLRRAGPHPRRRAGGRAPLADVREAVLGLRARQGHGARPGRPRHLERRARSSPTRSSTPDAVPEGAPAWPQPDGSVKTSAAWLIEHAGFAKGYGADRGRACPTKHTLALTNRGGATTADLLALAREVRDGVEAPLRHPPGQRAGAGRLRALSSQTLLS